MAKRARIALLKLADNGTGASTSPRADLRGGVPSFWENAYNFGASLFDGKRGTSTQYFNGMMNSDTMKNVGGSFNSFTNDTGKLINSFSDGVTGSTGTAFRNLYTGKGAPFAWGATAALMASAFNAARPNNNNSTGFGLGGLLGLGALGLGAYALYKSQNWIDKAKNTISSVNGLRSNNPQTQATVAKKLSADPATKAWVTKAVEFGATPEQRNAYFRAMHVSPMLQQNDPNVVKQGAEYAAKDPQNSWAVRWLSNYRAKNPDSAYTRYSMPVVEATNDPSLVKDTVAANNRLSQHGFNQKVINHAGNLNADVLANFDSKNLDYRGQEELKLLGQLRINPSAFNKQYMQIVNRSNMRRQKGATVTNPVTGGKLHLQKPAQTPAQ